MYKKNLWRPKKNSYDELSFDKNSMTVMLFLFCIAPFCNKCNFCIANVKKLLQFVLVSS